MKYAIVTGGTSGIGKQISHDLLKRGFFVFSNYVLNDSSIEQAKAEYKNISNNFLLIQSDFSDLNQIKYFTDSILSKTNKIDCFIGNAGTTLRKKTFEITNEEWEETLRINLNANFFIIRDVNYYFNEGSSIVFIGSILGKLPHATSLVYGVSKAALHSLALNLVKEFSGKRVRVNAILPGFVETDWQKSKPLEIRQNIYKKTALNRFATVNEISDACMFILENDFINGSLFEITGGYSYK